MQSSLKITANNKTYGYDANGNLTNDSRLAYYWDDENRLVEVRNARTGILLQQNRYDGLGRRREKIEATTTNRYLYQNWLVLAITVGAGNTLETYTHGADLSGHLGGSAGGIGGILSSTQSGFSAYYHYDFNGNIVQVTSATQTPITQITYTPFGEALLKEGPFTPRYQFSTKEHDALTKLTHYGYRFYSPPLAQWLCQDPIGEWGSINLYQFCVNTPTAFIDPKGLSSCIPQNCMEGEIIGFDAASAVITIIGEPTGPFCPAKEELPGKVKEGLIKEFKPGKKKEGCKGKDDCKKECFCDEANKVNYTGEWETIEFIETYKASFGACTFQYKVSGNVQYKGWVAPCIGKK